MLLAAGCGADKGDSGAACPRWSDPEAVATLALPDLDEASGLTGSTLHAGVLWTHNDDGDDGVLYAVDTSGTAVGSHVLGRDYQADWESVVATQSGDLLVGDIGDNDAARDDITILRTREPTELTDGSTADVVEIFRTAWPDGPIDAEAMLVDPSDGSVLVLSRASDRVDVLRLPDLDAGDTEARVVHSIDLDSGVLAGLGAVRGAEAQADGSVVLRLSDGTAWFASRGSAAESLRGPACLVPSPPEADGEGITSAGDDLYFIGEGSSPTLWAVRRVAP